MISFADDTKKIYSDSGWTEVEKDENNEIIKIKELLAEMLIKQNFLESRLI